MEDCEWPELLWSDLMMLQHHSSCTPEHRSSIALSFLTRLCCWDPCPVQPCSQCPGQAQWHSKSHQQRNSHFPEGTLTLLRMVSAMQQFCLQVPYAPYTDLSVSLTLLLDTTFLLHTAQSPPRMSRQKLLFPDL